jgi:hypothetical protein
MFKHSAGLFRRVFRLGDRSLADDVTPSAAGDSSPPPDDGLRDISGGRLVELPIEQELKDSYLTYAMSVIVSRALPDVRDGLKPSQRRILVAMNDLNLSPGAARVKCAKISGDTSGNYHPHGESVIYPTLVRMAQEWNMRHVLVDKQGNFGSIAGLPAAAMRYTEARLSPIASMMLDDLDLDTVDYVPSYDERNTEPVVLPSRFPNLVVNGAGGIAVGMATSIPPHNLGEVCRALVAMIDNPAISMAELLQIVHARPRLPDRRHRDGPRGPRPRLPHRPEHDHAPGPGPRRGVRQEPPSDRGHRDSLPADPRRDRGEDRRARQRRPDQGNLCDPQRERPQGAGAADPGIEARRRP